jgi:hypothetical protein
VILDELYYDHHWVDAVAVTPNFSATLLGGGARPVKIDHGLETFGGEAII